MRTTQPTIQSQTPEAFNIYHISICKELNTIWGQQSRVNLLIATQQHIPVPLTLTKGQTRCKSKGQVNTTATLQYWNKEKFSPLQEIKCKSLKPLNSQFTDWATVLTTAIQLTTNSHFKPIDPSSLTAGQSSSQAQLVSICNNNITSKCRFN